MTQRPIECAGCKKNTSIQYIELAKGKRTVLNICEGCPLLKQKIHQQNDHADSSSLCCNRCKTTFQSILRGGELGCPSCYQVFAQLLPKELMQREVILPHTTKGLQNTNSPSLHVGKVPNRNPKNTARLETLHSALQEALEAESYEIAASLRDQIQSIRERTGG